MADLYGNFDQTVADVIAAVRARLEGSLTCLLKLFRASFSSGLFGLHDLGLVQRVSAVELSPASTGTLFNAGYTLSFFLAGPGPPGGLG